MLKEFKNIPDFNFCQNWVWPCHALQSDLPSLKELRKLTNLRFMAFAVRNVRLGSLTLSRTFVVTPEHTALKDNLTKLIEKELNPHCPQWEAAKKFPAHKVCKILGSLNWYVRSLIQGATHNTPSFKLDLAKMVKTKGLKYFLSVILYGFRNLNNN